MHEDFPQFRFVWLKISQWSYQLSTISDCSHVDAMRRALNLWKHRNDLYAYELSRERSQQNSVVGRTFRSVHRWQVLSFQQRNIFNSKGTAHLFFSSFKLKVNSEHFHCNVRQRRSDSLDAAEDLVTTLFCLPTKLCVQFTKVQRVLWDLLVAFVSVVLCRIVLLSLPRFRVGVYFTAHTLLLAFEFEHCVHVYGAYV